MASKGQKLDPWESWNRKVFAFNDGLDAHVLKPVATAYSQLVPSPVRQGVDNFFNNIGDAWSAVNLVLQGRFKSAAEQGMRFAINSTLGIGGLLDIMGEAGLERNPQDLGKTFGRWGMGTGAYVVWPVFGPSSVRDSLALPFDRAFSPAVLVDNGGKKVTLTLVQAINARANFLRAGEMLDGIAFDKYTFYRDAYLQRRGSFDDDDEIEVLKPEAEPKPADKTDDKPAAEAATVKRPATPASEASK
jgi:phospholipid-binding lipoprotein MlaA